MSRKEIIMPALGMAQTTGIIVEWFREVGQTIKKDEPIISIETDKTTMDIPSSHDGVVVEITGESGVEIAVGTVIGWIETEAGADSVKNGAKKSSPKSQTKSSPVPTPAAEKKEESVVPPKLDLDLKKTKPLPRNKETENRVLISPKAGRMAREQGISLDSLLRNRQLIQPFDSRDIENHITWIQKQDSGRELSPTRLEGSVSAVQFLGMSKMLQSEHPEEFDPAQLWAGINAVILHRHTLLREHLGIPGSPMARVLDVRQGRWEEYYLKEFTGLRLEKNPREPAEPGPVHVIYIEHPHVQSVALPVDSLLRIMLTLNSMNKTGKVLFDSNISLENPSLLLPYFEDLVSAFENPLNLLL